MPRCLVDIKFASKERFCSRRQYLPMVITRGYFYCGSECFENVITIIHILLVLGAQINPLAEYRGSATFLHVILRSFWIRSFSTLLVRAYQLFSRSRVYYGAIHTQQLAKITCRHLAGVINTKIFGKLSHSQYYYHRSSSNPDGERGGKPGWYAKMGNGLLRSLLLPRRDCFIKCWIFGARKKRCIAI